MIPISQECYDAWLVHNNQEKNANLASFVAGFHAAEAAQPSAQRTELWLCKKCETCNLGTDDKCWSCESER